MYSKIENTPSWKHWTTGQLRGEAIGGLCLCLFLIVIIAVMFRNQRREEDILATSVNKIVKVTGKHPPRGKGHPRKVYILDGVVPVGIATGARWYFQTSVGYPALVKYSQKYHQYRQPYASAKSDQGFMVFLGIMLFIMAVMTFSAFTNLQKRSKENPDAGAPGLSLN